MMVSSDLHSPYCEHALVRVRSGSNHTRRQSRSGLIAQGMTRSANATAVGVMKRSSDHHEVDGLQGAVQTRRVLAHVGDRVGGLDPKHLHGMGLLGLDGLQDGVGLRGGGEAVLLQRVALHAQAVLHHVRALELLQMPEL